MTPPEKEPLAVRPVRGLRGVVTVPGDKSLSHRSLILGALSEREVRVRNLSHGDDVRSTRRCLEMLGAVVHESGGEVFIRGRAAGFPAEPKDVLDAGNSGTTLRLLAGLLSAQPFFSVLTGDGSLRSRPMGRVVKPLLEMGARISGREQGRFAPLAISGGALSPIAYESPIASAQVKTAVLLAGLSVSGETRFTEPHVSRDHTERMLEYMGAGIRRQGSTVCLEGGRPLIAEEFFVSGDPSSAAFFVVAALITRESDLVIRDICMNPTRIGCLKVLQRMGARIESGAARQVSGEPVADLRVFSSSLRATEITPDEIPSCIDEIPVLCIAAALAEGTTRIRGAQELRVKESDRIAAMAHNLARMGIPVREEPDGMFIEGRQEIRGFQGESRGDHRIAMSLAVAGLAAEGPSEISGADCMSISFPGFWDRLAPLLVS